MYTEDNITDKLNNTRPTLSQTERDALFANIAKETILKEETAISPYYTLFTSQRWLAPVALVLMLMIGTGGVVAVAEAAKPGDTLFAVDQTVENIRLALASEDTRVKLEAEFAAERLLELSASLEESLKRNREQNTDQEDRTDDKARVNETLGFTISYLAKTDLSSSTKGGLYDELAKLLEGAPVRIDDKKLRTYDTESRIEFKEDNDDRRIEIRDGENRLRIREKNGELRIEHKDSWENTDEDEDENEDEDGDDNKEKGDDNDDNDLNEDTSLIPYTANLKTNLELKTQSGDEGERDRDKEEESEKDDTESAEEQEQYNQEDEPDDDEKEDNEDSLEIEFESELELEIND